MPLVSGIRGQPGHGGCFIGRPQGQLGPGVHKEPAFGPLGLDTNLAGNWSPTSFTAPALDAESIERVRALLELSRAQRAKVVIYLPPYHPRALTRYLKESSFASLRKRLVSQLGEWAQSYPVDVYDFTDVATFGGRSDMFYDASHPREDACRLMTDAMSRSLE